MRILALLTMVGCLFSISAAAETTECNEISALPAVITAQGIYCLKGNLVTGMATGNAIEIQTNNVTIDLNGFKLGGSSAGEDTEAVGIYANNQKNITILNGTIRGFQSGVFLDGSLSFGHLIEQIRADRNRRFGLRVVGDNSVIRSNHIINTGDANSPTAFGISARTGNNIIIIDNVVGEVVDAQAIVGIFVDGVSVGTISGNYVYNVKSLAGYGIRVNNSQNVSIVENRITNDASGSTGILGINSSSGIDCIGNIVRDYPTPTSGCDYSSGNYLN